MDNKATRQSQLPTDGPELEPITNESYTDLENILVETYK